jgi:ABC-type transport system substrate-binding protein
VDSVQVIDDYTVTMFLDEPATLELLEWDVYYPHHLLEHLEPSEYFEWDFWTHPVGNGLYGTLATILKRTSSSRPTLTTMRASPRSSV